MGIDKMVQALQGIICLADQVQVHWTVRGATVCLPSGRHDQRPRDHRAVAQVEGTWPTATEFVRW